MSVTTYHYEAIDAQGVQTKGVIRAVDEAEAYRKLAVSEHGAVFSTHARTLPTSLR